MKFKVGDNVLVTGGKDKGRKGKIERAYPQTGKVMVKGVNQYKRHVKRQGENQPGGILTLERPLPLAKVALICPKCQKVTRIGYQMAKTGGQKQRICKKCQGVL